MEHETQTLTSDDIGKCIKVLRALVNYADRNGDGIMDTDTYYNVVKAIESYESSETKR